MVRVASILLLGVLMAAFPSAAVGPTTSSTVSDLAGHEKVSEPAFEYCGDVRPVFLNPDLQPQADGFVHASGWFFIQFQIIADSPDFQMDRLTFSFGKPVPAELRTCDAPEWITGAYLKDYRVDDDPTDGFFIPINTSNVPDGEWAAAISVYQGDTEIGRAYTTAIVENGCPLGYRHPDCPANVRANDRVRPWPIVLPGDGQQIHGVNGLTIEFAEPVVNVRATLDGVEVELTEMEPRLWDEDSVPAALDEDMGQCSLPDPICAQNPWGPAFQWQGEIPDGAVVSVSAEDLNGNTVSKILHLTSTAVGGIISVQLPDLNIKIEEATKTVGVGETAEFPVTFVNVGRDTAHTNLHVDAPEGIEVTWEPNHVVVPSGEEVSAVLKAKGATQGTYELAASAEYKAGTQDVSEPIPLTLTIGQASEEVMKANTSTPDEEIELTEEEDTNDSPGPAALLALGLMAVAAVAARRRH